MKALVTKLSCVGVCIAATGAAVATPASAVQFQAVVKGTGLVWHDSRTLTRAQVQEMRDGEARYQQRLHPAQSLGGGIEDLVQRSAWRLAGFDRVLAQPDSEFLPANGAVNTAPPVVTVPTASVAPALVSPRPTIVSSTVLRPPTVLQPPAVLRPVTFPVLPPPPTRSVPPAQRPVSTTPLPPPGETRHPYVCPVHGPAFHVCPLPPARIPTGVANAAPKLPLPPSPKQLTVPAPQPTKPTASNPAPLAAQALTAEDQKTLDDIVNAFAAGKIKAALGRMYIWYGSHSVPQRGLLLNLLMMRVDSDARLLVSAHWLLCAQSSKTLKTAPEELDRRNRACFLLATNAYNSQIGTEAKQALLNTAGGLRISSTIALKAAPNETRKRPIEATQIASDPAPAPRTDTTSPPPKRVAVESPRRIPAELEIDDPSAADDDVVPANTGTEKRDAASEPTGPTDTMQE